MRIQFNDGLVWFCYKGVNGCDTMPQWFAWLGVICILLAFVVGFFVGRKR